MAARAGFVQIYYDLHTCYYKLLIFHNCMVHNYCRLDTSMVRCRYD